MMENKVNPTEELKALEFPFDTATITRKRLGLRRILKNGLTQAKPLRVAILGGVTSSEFKNIAELFLLKTGFAPEFYESEYGRFFEDGAFDNVELQKFSPEIVIIFSHWKNITRFPKCLEPEESVDALFESELARFQAIWKNIEARYGSIIIQNNFDLPPTRILGNRDAVEYYGTSHFLLRLNAAFADAARHNSRLLINDIHYLAMQMGLQAWHDPSAWFNYKLAFSAAGNISIAFNTSIIIQAIYGLSKKTLVVDLDNTLWGGVIGDDGVDRIEIGRETATAEAHLDFQEYLKSLQMRGILLTVCSKNDEPVAKSGFERPDSHLRLNDFSAFRANWNPKHENIESIAAELNLGLDSFVFIDDNPAERLIVKSQLPQVAVPEVGSDIIHYKSTIDRSGYFETTQLVTDDVMRSEFYKKNQERASSAAQFKNYEEYLLSLEMTAEIEAFSSTYMSRITQLINKTNQFNLTTRRYSDAETNEMAQNPKAITLYGKLVDKFGDNGLISIIIAEEHPSEANAAIIDTWLMSCRVLKREMESAMLDALVEVCISRGIKTLYGRYHRTKKNDMVSQHYASLGFECLERTEDSSQWKLQIQLPYLQRCKVIRRTYAGNPSASAANFS